MRFRAGAGEDEFERSGAVPQEKHRLLVFRENV